MYSTTTLAKDPKLSGKIMGTHQLLDQAARQTLGQYLPAGRYFPSSKEIIYFEGVRGPDGLKRKSPEQDDLSHMYDEPDGGQLLTQILDHYHNLVLALRDCNHVRAAFEAAWLAHMLVDGLTPAHHFPLDNAKEELMSNKEFVKVFGEPIKGVMRGRTPLETMRNNWLYWGAGGYMSKHIAYEYGVALIVAVLPHKTLRPPIAAVDLQNLDVRQIFADALGAIKPKEVYNQFRQDGWTTELAFATKDVLAPQMVRAIVRCWYAAMTEAYGEAEMTVGQNSDDVDQKQGSEK